MRLLGAKLALARAVGVLARRAGRGGTSLPGKVLLRMEPGALEALAGRLENGAAVISATNGKTTTAGMAAEILGRAGHVLVHNRAGANMAGGVASALLDAAQVGGGGIRTAGDLGLFEVDEFWLEEVTTALRPRALLLGNLFRDQLDRYGELDSIAERWRRVASTRPSGSALLLNADDPAVADLGRGQEDVTYFGVEDPGVALPGMQHAADAKHCRNCGHAYVYAVVFLAHLGHYHCPSCGRMRPAPTVAAERVVLHGTRSAELTLRASGQRVDVALPLPGLYNVYNALAAAALALSLGATLEQVRAGLEGVSAAFGRAETVAVAGRPLQILLVKNPAGANEVLRTLALEGEELELLGILNDGIADGRDISWVWDADWEVLAGRIARVTCAGTRAGELALRLKYAGIPPERLHVVPEVSAALDAAVGADGAGTVHALPTYTALLALRDELARRGLAPRWSEA